MKKYKVLFCDLDGTLIEPLSKETFPKGIWDMKFKFDVLDAIKKLNPEYVFIVTNQGGIEKDFVNREKFINKCTYVIDCISEYCNINKFKIDCSYCITNNKNDLRRKPNIEMLEESWRSVPYFIKKNESVMIGDASDLEGQFSDNDKKTAENFGIDYLNVNEFVKLYNN